MKLRLLVPRPGARPHDAAADPVHEMLARVDNGSLSRVTIANESPLIRLTARSPHTHDQPIGLGLTLTEGCRHLLLDLEEAIREAPTRASDGRPLLRVLPGGLDPARTPLPTAPIAG